LIAVQLAREFGPTLGRGLAGAVDRGPELTSAVLIGLGVWLGHDHVDEGAVDGVDPAVGPGVAATVQAARLALKNRTAAGNPNLA
jgi:hypothetical protein